MLRIVCDKVLKKRVEKTAQVVAEYVEPCPRGAEETVEKVIETVDTEEVKDALDGFEESGTAPFAQPIRITKMIRSGRRTLKTFVVELGGG